jgi:RHS repeat-associated protein
MTTSPGSTAGTTVPIGSGPVRNGTFLPFSVSDSVSLGVNAGSGNALVTTSDMTIPEITAPLTLGVAYNSLLLGADVPAGSYAHAWRQRVGCDVRLEVASDGSVTFVGVDGVAGKFVPLPGSGDPGGLLRRTLHPGRTVSGSGYTSPPQFQVTLERAAGGGWTMDWYMAGLVWSFDSGGRLTSTTCRNGNTTAFGYDSSGHETTITYTPNGAQSPAWTVEAAYTGDFLTSLTWHGGSSGTKQAIYGVDRDGNLESVTQPDGTQIRFGYDTSDRLISITNGKGAKIRLGYDDKHRVVSVVQASDTAVPCTTRFAYPADGTTLVTDPNTDQSQPVAAVPHLTYAVDTATSLITKITDQEGNSRSATYTPFGDTATLTNALGGTSTGTYGANDGQSLTSLQIPTGAALTFDYTNTATTQNPFANYQPSSWSDPQGNTTAFTYNGPGNVTQATSALAATAKVSYNADGTPASSTAPGNGSNSTTYQYNASRQLDEITPVTGSTLQPRTITYDGFGRPATFTDGGGHLTAFRYDLADRIVETACTGTGDPVTVHYAYDRAGNIITRRDRNGVTAWEYDERNLVISRRDTGDDRDEAHQAYRYDRAGNLIAVEDHSGITTYAYDTRNLLIALTDPADKHWAFAYDGDAHRTETRFAIEGSRWAAISTYRYDQSGRITRIQAVRNADDGQATVFDVSNDYSADGKDTALVQSATDNVTGTVSSYSYDDGNRLTKATHTGGHDYGYHYDANGNITSVDIDGQQARSWTYNPANQITSEGYSYDGAGNQTEDPAAGTLTYNDAGQMISASSAGQREVLVYADITQAELLSAGTARRIRYGLATGNGQPWVQSYIPRPQPGREQSGRDRSPDNTVHIVHDQQGTPLGMLHDRRSHIYIADHLGTVTGICGSDGRQQASYAYDPYGQVTTANGPLAALNLVRYTGAFADPAGAGARGTGFTHMGNRWQDPAAGRFTQQDMISQIADPANGNLYSYAADNPVNYIDPTGAQPQWLDTIGGYTAGGAGIGTAVGCLVVGIPAGGAAFLFTLFDPVAGAVGFGTGCVSGAGTGLVVGGVIGAFVGIGVDIAHLF